MQLKTGSLSQPMRRRRDQHRTGGLRDEFTKAVLLRISQTTKEKGSIRKRVGKGIRAPIKGRCEIEV